MKQKSERRLYIVLISVHGLIRGHDLELGRDADTGGQTKYVLELARALAVHPRVERVDLLTRLISDQKVSRNYAEPEEKIAPRAFIIRIPCGPRRYLRKEVLWPYLDSFADQALQHIRRVGRVPDVVHAHYADAGYVGVQLANLLGVPMIFTGHSLGRIKRERLLEKGLKDSTIESQYNISQRIEAEEGSLDNAALVVASTQQEVNEQYCQYDEYEPENMVVIPPGVDLSRFSPPKRKFRVPSIIKETNRFFRNPRKPIILALSRPDERKNITTLIRAFGSSDELREMANLIVIAGNRTDITTMEKGSREVLTNILLLIDRYNLYGCVAYPKSHAADDVPDLFRMAARSGGVFINPALTEPFGLTIIEAAACGLPVIATHDGGPTEILGNCKNGFLIDPLDVAAMSATMIKALSNKVRWKRWAAGGIRCANNRYSWSSHANTYIRHLERVTGVGKRNASFAPNKSRLPTVDRILVSDIDNTLVGDEQGLIELLNKIGDTRSEIGFAVATGRSLQSAIEVLAEWQVPMPDILITSVGAEIYYGHKNIEDVGWKRHIEYQWEPEKLRRAMRGLSGVRLQPKREQREHKISYFLDPLKAPSEKEIIQRLRKLGLRTKAIFSHDAYLDLLPIRASKGLAMRYLGVKWGLSPERFLVAGDSGNDKEMLEGDTLGVVVGNYSPELDTLRGRPRIYFAEQEAAYGILEGIEHYNFLGKIRIQEEA